MTYDMVIVGGGIHGVGVAQAAAAWGYRTLLLEKERPAAGTSSRSSKLIHGGLRYLESLQFHLVRESLREREILLRIAPDLVRLVPFLIPIYKGTSRHPWEIRLGLTLYAALGGFSPSARFRMLERPEWKTVEGIRTEGLRAIFSYLDAQTDDAALTEAVLRSAISLGAEALYPAEFLSAEKDGRGYRIRFTQDGEERECYATVLINAAGPWINQIQERITPRLPPFAVELVQGAHTHLDQPLSPAIIYVEAPRDRRAVFIMPWKGGTLVGTTETPFTGDPDLVKPLPEEITYLDETLRFHFPDYPGRLVGSMAGLRVLPKGSGSPFRRSRETILSCDNNQNPHLIAIQGGKLTTYRATAERVMGLARRTLHLRKPMADTSRLELG
jgi:glycerol-3-phosphate dehydrogenase